MRGAFFFAGVMFTALFLNTTVRADDWCHLRLKSTNNTTINIDYQLYSFIPYRSTGTVSGGKFVWINVANANFSGQEKVRAILIDNVFCLSNYEGERFEYSQRVQTDLSWVSDKSNFTSHLSDIYLGTQHHNGWCENRMELAVVVDGNWLTANPATGEHNFKFVPFRNSDGCPK